MIETNLTNSALVSPKTEVQDVEKCLMKDRAWIHETVQSKCR